MKTTEERNALRPEAEALNARIAELTGGELEQVIGGLAKGRKYWGGNAKPKKDRDTGNGEED